MLDLILACNALLNVSSLYSRLKDPIRSSVLSINAERLAGFSLTHHTGLSLESGDVSLHKPEAGHLAGRISECSNAVFDGAHVTRLLLADRPTTVRLGGRGGMRQRIPVKFSCRLT